MHVALPAHCSRITRSMLSLAYCLCGVLLVVFLSVWVSPGISGFFQLPKTMNEGELPQGMDECVRVCPALDWYPIKGVMPWIHCLPGQDQAVTED